MFSDIKELYDEMTPPNELLDKQAFKMKANIDREWNYFSLFPLLFGKLGLHCACPSL